MPERGCGIPAFRIKHPSGEVPVFREIHPRSGLFTRRFQPQAAADKRLRLTFRPPHRAFKAAPEKQDANLKNARYGKNKSLKITSEREEFSRRPDEVSGLRELQRVRRVWTRLPLPLQLQP